MATLLPFRQEVRGLHTVETIKRDIESNENPRAKAFWHMNYSRLTDEARAYLNTYVKRES